MYLFDPFQVEVQEKGKVPGTQKGYQNVWGLGFYSQFFFEQLFFSKWINWHVTPHGSADASVASATCRVSPAKCSQGRMIWMREHYFLWSFEQFSCPEIICQLDSSRRTRNRNHQNSDCYRDPSGYIRVTRSVLNSTDVRPFLFLFLREDWIQMNLWHSMTFYDILWHSMTFYDILWHSMTFYDILWHSMTILTFYDDVFECFWYVLFWPWQVQKFEARQSQSQAMATGSRGS